MTITWGMFIWGFGILVAWTTFLLGIIKILLGRQLNSFVTKQAETDAKAVDALKQLEKYKLAAAAELSDYQKASAAELANYQKAAAMDLAALKLEFSQKSTCGNHQRMERNDEKLFERLDQLHGDISKLVGGVEGLSNSLRLVNEHLISGGK